MPSGDKIVVQLIVDTHMIQLSTFTPDAEIVRQIEGPVNETDNPDWHHFSGLNANDQSVLVKVRRGKINGYIIAPLVRTAVQPAQGRIVQ